MFRKSPSPAAATAPATAPSAGVAANAKAQKEEWAPGYHLGKTTFGFESQDNETFCHPQLNRSPVLNHLRHRGMGVVERVSRTAPGQNACVFNRGAGSCIRIHHSLVYSSPYRLIIKRRESISVIQNGIIIRSDVGRESVRDEARMSVKAG